MNSQPLRVSDYSGLPPACRPGCSITKIAATFVRRVSTVCSAAALSIVLLLVCIWTGTAADVLPAQAPARMKSSAPDTPADPLPAQAPARMKSSAPDTPANALPATAPPRMKSSAPDTPVNPLPATAPARMKSSALGAAADTTKPTGALSVSPASAAPGQTISITVTGSDNKDVDSLYAYYGGSWH
ncbi:MAG: hypothetical protein HY796_06355, partial [Elusimicrobia bacterium]|nr:hypothetical protein [Elusimicrobiota bacterium]